MFWIYILIGLLIACFIFKMNSSDLKDIDSDLIGFLVFIIVLVWPTLILFGLVLHLFKLIGFLMKSFFR